MKELAVKNDRVTTRSSGGGEEWWQKINKMDEWETTGKV